VDFTSSAAVLYNHESPRRPASFVARKIALGVARISRVCSHELVLWQHRCAPRLGLRPDYVAAMRRIIEQPAPDDYIVASGEARTVRDYVAEAFAYVDIKDWESEGSRPTQPCTGPPIRSGSSVTRARFRGIGWRPTMTFSKLVATMIDAEIALHVMRWSNAPQETR
jgi:GDPmannose 4,6-dehydratase